MSVYSTMVAIVDDGTPGAAEGGPYKYLGSHILPDTDGERAGAVFLCRIPDHVAENRNMHDNAGNTHSGKVDLVRLSVDDGEQQATVLLGRDHITEIHNALGAWLTADRHW